MERFPLKFVGPHWPHLSHVHAFTFLGVDLAGKPVNFQGRPTEPNPAKSELEAIYGDINWIGQVHGKDILTLPQVGELTADGLFTAQAKVPCVIRTADCLPVLFSNSDGTKVGIVHAGWRGLAAEIIPAMVQQFGEPPASLWAWIGPGIAQASYEVGEELYDAFAPFGPKYTEAFLPGEPGKYYADLARIAALQLLACGLPSTQISGGEWDTYSDLNMHSYRRDGQNSGRMASLICML